MAWPHQKQNEYHKLIAGEVPCVVYVPDHENVRGCGGIAAISPNLGTSGRWRGGSNQYPWNRRVAGHSPMERKMSPFPGLDRWFSNL
jgi:hypothetical protein